MEKLDIAFLIIVILGIIWGFITGLVSMLISISCFLLAIYILPDYIRAFEAERGIEIIHSKITYYILFAIAITLCLVIGKAVAGIITKALKLMLLNGINRAIGALVGMVLAIFVCSVLVTTGSQVPEKKPIISKSLVDKSSSAKFFLFVGKLFPLNQSTTNSTQSTTE